MANSGGLKDLITGSAGPVKIGGQPFLWGWRYCGGGVAIQHRSGCNASQVLRMSTTRINQGEG